MKKIIGIFVCMLMVIPVLSTTALADPGPEFEIDYSPFYIGNIWFDVTNVGDADAINVEWMIDFKVIIDSPSLPPPWNGTIEHLSVGETERIATYGGFVFGFGIKDITIKLKADNAEEVTVTAKGIFFGPIIIIPRPL